METAKHKNSTENRPATGVDWELQQALNHLQNAIIATDSDSAHKLITAKNIIKGVRERD